MTLLTCTMKKEVEERNPSHGADTNKLCWDRPGVVLSSPLTFLRELRGPFMQIHLDKQNSFFGVCTLKISVSLPSWGCTREHCIPIFWVYWIMTSPKEINVFILTLESPDSSVEPMVPHWADLGLSCLWLPYFPMALCTKLFLIKVWMGFPLCGSLSHDPSCLLFVSGNTT